MGMSEEQKQRAEKSVVEDIVNAVEFGQMASQVNLAAGGQAAAAMFNMAAMCSTQEFKQEQLMQGEYCSLSVMLIISVVMVISLGCLLISMICMYSEINNVYFFQATWNHSIVHNSSDLEILF